ncbi:DUF4166 domain-containing protein [Paucisalibacillus sp. EB02]|uniref:DUF4166 domain-containing protein n=1 Tax=Paucisalibacillus sp. EB02 TaxID=1347087 RepID=UPI0004B81AE4|nr:DUF4166 domain-containing protein [Paucisalibacillus sp. EB02]
MSIYKTALGDDFEKLHPMLRQRYKTMGKRTFKGSGIMHTIVGCPRWLYPICWYGVKWKLLFPERGENILFTICNTPTVGENGEEQIHWERKFQFGKKERYFNALMSLDRGHNIIRDYLGEPAKVYSDLTFRTDKDGSLLISSKKQRLVLGRKEIPLPRIFQGIATVKEGYCDTEQTYIIHVNVRNPIIGTVFSYKGVFTEDELS